MRIAIDARHALAERRTGKGAWARMFLEELLRRDHDVILYVDGPVPEEIRKRAADVVRFPSGLRWHFSVAKALRNATVDFFLSPTSYIVPALQRKIPTGVVVHDMIAFRGEPHDKKATMIERLTLGKALKNAARVFAISEATSRDLQRYSAMQKPTVVLHAGPTHLAASSHRDDGKTILCLGTLCPRKNQLRLIRAFASLPDALRSKHELLLIGGRGWNDAEIVEEAAKTPNVRWLDYADDETCKKLLSTVSVFALPSLYEGFGLPVLDAMTTGVAVLTADRGSLREVGGDAALYADPESVPSIADALRRLHEDDKLRHDFAERGKERAKAFSWKKCVDVFLASIASPGAKH